MSGIRADRALAAVLALAVPAAALGGCGGDDASSAKCNSGTICSWAGTGEKAFNGDGLDRRVSAMYWPMDLEFAPDGRPYVLDWNNHRVRRVNTDDKFETVIGTDNVGDGPYPDASPERVAPGVPGTTVYLNHPTDVVFAPDGSLILAAWHNHKIRRLDLTTGLVDITCGNGPGYNPPGDGVPALTALMNQPKAVVVDASGAIFAVDARNFRVRRIGPDGVIQTVVGVGMRGFAGDGGPVLQAQFAFQRADDDNPEPGGGLAMDPQAPGVLYIVDTWNQRIRRADLANDVVETIAGNGTAGFSGDGGPATEASLNYPHDVEVGPDGRLYIADTDNHRVRALDLTTGIITTVAGNGNNAYGGDGGDPLRASLNRPFGVAFDAAGNLFIADTYNNRIRKVTR
jgi:sugar lactone lactonase YvrE